MEKVREAWIAALNKEVSQSSKICSTHFRDDDFISTDGTAIRRLKKEAVPSINLETKTDCKRYSLFF